ncbi:MAG: class SAM-dependent methyltransferase [Acidimicrobiales bacterium]|nr:class SAM-dependent methyltransferase [Acidimicrobiales bacterium]
MDDSQRDGPDAPGELESIYATRFGARSAERTVLWQTLVTSYFQRFVEPSDTVLDLAAGYCEFINTVRCGTKIAVDLNPTIAAMAGSDVAVHVAPSTALPDELTDAVDVAWVSNFFEHLADSAELLATLRELHRVLRPGGRLLVLQPNIRLTKTAYWDFVDHSLPVTEKRLVEALTVTGFSVELMKVRFLPYTTKSRIPISPALIRLYLRFPPAQWLMGKQTFVVARAGT